MPADPPSADRSRQHATLILLWILAAVCAGRVGIAAGPNRAEASVRVGINPNRAPWWDLTLLPEIGPTTARAIVDLRKDVAMRDDETPGHSKSAASRSAFARPIDLTRVKGIGPRTIERCGRYLRFGAAWSSNNDPTTGSARLGPWSR